MSQEKSEDKGGVVVDLAEKKEEMKVKKKSKKSRSDEVSVADIYEEFTEALNNPKDPDDQDPKSINKPFLFQRCFKKVRNASGDPEIIELLPNKLCKTVEKTEVGAALSYYVHRTYLKDPQRFLEPYDADKIATHWFRSTDLFPFPDFVVWANEMDRYAFHRMPFRYVPDVDLSQAPVFKEFLDRMSNSASFVLFIGSLFFKEADRQQYVWLYGKGNNGKGAFARLLVEVFGPLHVALEPITNQFWTASLLNKRIGIFGECDDGKFISKGKFKSLTGGDAIPVEKKGKDRVTTMLQIKFLFLSNEQPVINMEKADLRRIIFCEISPFMGKAMSEKKLHEALKAESEVIFSFCRKKYEDFVLHNDHTGLPNNQDQIEDLAASNEMVFETIFDNNFYIIDRSDLDKAVTRNELTEVLLQYFRSDWNKHKQFKDWLKRLHDIDYRRPRTPDGRQLKCFPGITYRHKKGWVPPKPEEN